jgi:hypothetical protein
MKATGGYAETERVIQSLLQERNAQLGLGTGFTSSNNTTAKAGVSTTVILYEKLLLQVL